MPPIEPPRSWNSQQFARIRIPVPFHWWRTVFFLIPAIALYTIVLGTLSLTSSLFQKTGYFAHWCARTWSRLILATTGVRVEVVGLERLERGTTYVFVSNHQSIYDIPILFWSLPYQLRIIAKESLGSFPFLGWHLRRTGHMLVDRQRPDRSKIFGWASRLTSNGLSLIVFPEGHAQSRWPRRAVQGRQLLPRAAGRSAGRADLGRRQPARDAEGTARDVSRRREARRPRADRHQRRSRRPTAREFAERVRQIIAPVAESDVSVAPPDHAPSNAVEALRRA